MRHAERYDCVWDTTPWLFSTEFQQWPGDPPLSTEGIEHAKEVGEHLREKDQMKNLQHIIVISSPYLRCVQTAAEICRSFGRSSIFIDNKIGEIWNPDVVGESGCAIRPLTEGVKWCKERGIAIKGEPLGSWPVWPETESEAEARYALRFLQYGHMSLSKKSCAFILVTHGDGVRSMLQTLPEYAGIRCQGVEYCGRFVAWNLPIARHDTGVKSSLGIHSMCNEAWQVQTHGIKMRTSSSSKEMSQIRQGSKDTSQSNESTRHGSQDSSQSSECTIANQSYPEIWENESSLNLSPIHKRLSFDIISEAVSVGNWPPNEENALHERTFSTLDDESAEQLVLPSQSSQYSLLSLDTPSSSRSFGSEASNPCSPSSSHATPMSFERSKARRRSSAGRYRSCPSPASFTTMQSHMELHSTRVPRTFDDCDDIVTRGESQLPPSPSNEVSLASPRMISSKLMMRRRMSR